MLPYLNDLIISLMKNSSWETTKNMNTVAPVDGMLPARNFEASIRNNDCMINTTIITPHDEKKALNAFPNPNPIAAKHLFLSMPDCHARA